MHLRFYISIPLDFILICQSSIVQLNVKNLLRLSLSLFVDCDHILRFSSRAFSTSKNRTDRYGSSTSPHAISPAKWKCWSCRMFFLAYSNVDAKSVLGHHKNALTNTSGSHLAPCSLFKHSTSTSGWMNIGKVDFPKWYSE